MAPQISVRLSNRTPKRPIKKLPASIDVPASATVEDVKKVIARQAGISDFNRVGLFDPTTKKTLKNRKSLIGEEKCVKSLGELLVKDLGMCAISPQLYVFNVAWDKALTAVIPNRSPSGLANGVLD
jgi:very-long-chain enoyl-CoA reductase